MGEWTVIFCWQCGGGGAKERRLVGLAAAVSGESESRDDEVGIMVSSSGHMLKKMNKKFKF